MTDTAGDVTAEEASRDAVRLQRLVVIVLLGALAASAVALWLGVRGTRTSAVMDAAQARPSFPKVFVDKTGFADAPLHLVRVIGGTSRQTTASGVTPRATGSTFVVARCRAGTITVTLGALSSQAQCGPDPIGVIAFSVPAGTTVTATVDRRQSAPWGIAVYH